MTPRELLDTGYRYALSLTGNRADAEDLVQDAWIRLYRAGGDKSRRYLFVTIRRLYIDEYRHRACLTLVPLDAAPEIRSESRELHGAEIAHDLEEPLRGLRTEEREALFLNVVEGYTAREIAEMSQRPRGTVLSLIHRAREKLRNALTHSSRHSERIRAARG